MIASMGMWKGLFEKKGCKKKKEKLVSINFFVILQLNEVNIPTTQ